VKSPLRPLTKVLGQIPCRLALAGGWIDQPFVSQHNPTPPGAMVVVCIQPNFPVMTRSGLASGTRSVATRLWGDRLPARDPSILVQELYAAENEGKSEPSGSQDMIGLIYPGISRLDYDFKEQGGVFPAHIESINDPEVGAWLESVLQLLPVAQRPDGYSPLGEKNLDPKWISRLGQSGHDCFEAIRRMSLAGLGGSLNECMRCWQALLPGTVRHPTISVDLLALLGAYQAEYPGAMYSGCGGGYLFVVSEQPVPGAMRITVRLAGG
jgi:hypothetical protein